MKANAHNRIIALRPDRQQKIDMMLIKDESAASVARVIQDDWKFYADEKFETVKKAVVRYRKDAIDVPTAARQKSIARSKNPETQRKLLKAAEQFDLTGEWVTTIRKQLKRIARNDELEGKMKIPMARQTQELKLLVDMLDKFGRFAMDSGLIRRMPRDVRALIGVGDLSTEDHPMDTTFEARVQHTAERHKAARKLISILRGEDEPELAEGASLLEHLEHDVEEAEYAEHA